MNKPLFKLKTCLNVKRFIYLFKHLQDTLKPKWLLLSYLFYKKFNKCDTIYYVPTKKYGYKKTASRAVLKF